MAGATTPENNTRNGPSTWVLILPGLRPNTDLGWHYEFIFLCVRCTERSWVQLPLGHSFFLLHKFITPKCDVPTPVHGIMQALATGLWTGRYGCWNAKLSKMSRKVQKWALSMPLQFSRLTPHPNPLLTLNSVSSIIAT